MFATVGTQLPFPRMIAALDRIAGEHGLSVFAQTADPHCRCAHIETAAQLPPEQFDRRARAAEVLVGHAGIGTIIAAKKFGKPAILFPRRWALGEHRNDHQIATARAVDGTRGVHIAWDEDVFEQLLTSSGLEPAAMESSPAREALIAHLSNFIVGVDARRS